MFFRKLVWSPVEIEYLKAHRTDTSIDQLALALAKSRNAVKNKLAEFDGKVVTKKMGRRSVIGRRTDLNHFFRSNWEANCARVWNKENKKWEYEPKVFVFDGVKHGTVSYCPDFKVEDGWVEVKGYLDNKAKTALRRFKKSYPEEFRKLQGIVGRKGTAAEKFFKSLGVPILAYYNELEKKWKSQIEHWE